MGILRAINFNQAGKTKALGLKWDLQSNTFEFNLSIKDQNKFTKRGVLSTIAHIFGKLG